jgi:hypothetical protein
VSGPIWPGAWHPATRGRPTSWLGLGLAAQSRPRKCPVERERGALAGTSVVAGRRQGAVGELTGATGRAPGKAVGGGAHPNGGAAWTWWRSLGTATFVGRERAPVAGGDGGAALQCRCGRGKVRAASIWDNGRGWEGHTVKRRRRCLSVGNWRGGGVSSGGSR